ncbi:hypothetical protein [Streptomyces orinoci]|uniref:Uncharacterized protein n=1 Tax=Streptomyces orinoci TaxID=67339 RepID=A0ABV3JY89_STRON|nr:hypothetical protein [Streptomyces orinoci]
MRTARVLTGAGLAIAAFGLAGGPAFAGDFDKLEISPSGVQPGATVTVSTLACGKKGMGNGDASAVGGPASFDLKASTHEELVTGQFKVPDTAKNGTYGIGVRCKNGKEATGDLMVNNGSSPAPSGSPAKEMPAGPGKAMPPKGGMKTGVGGTSDDSGTAEIVAGAAVLATAAVGGTFVLRRRMGSGRL